MDGCEYGERDVGLIGVVLLWTGGVKIGGVLLQLKEALGIFTIWIVGLGRS